MRWRESSFARNLLVGFAAIGSNPRRVLQRARDAFLRPARNELAALRAELVAERTERRSRETLLELIITESLGPISLAVKRSINDIPSPIVSVILPTRDRGRFIGEAIESVQSQTFADWELIIIDDGSVDDTTAVIEPYLADTRIRYIKQPNSGSSAARNRGLSLARGALIAHLDSDNVWYENFLTAAVRQFAIDSTRIGIAASIRALSAAARIAIDRIPGEGLRMSRIKIVSISVSPAR